MRMHRTEDVEKAPWETARATPADRALGLELELIELESRRAAEPDPSALNAEASAILQELASTAEPVVPVAAPPVRIRVRHDPAA
ncbi:MAG: hypothetical protein JWN46_805 [Acidimicrobiales bacterium]|nr:hypothetical protein [Acidimicrobiales bacterium]